GYVFHIVNGFLLNLFLREHPPQFHDEMAHHYDSHKTGIIPYRLTYTFQLLLIPLWAKLEKASWKTWQMSVGWHPRSILKVFPSRIQSQHVYHVCFQYDDHDKQ